jgi:hypothetical protein
MACWTTPGGISARPISGDRLEYDIQGGLGAQHRALNGYFGGNSNVVFWDVSRDHNRLLLRGERRAGSGFLVPL